MNVDLPKARLLLEEISQHLIGTSPGPWRMYRDGYIYDNDRSIVLETFGYTDPHGEVFEYDVTVSKNDHALIEAAPSLLSAAADTISVLLVEIERLNDVIAQRSLNVTLNLTISDFSLELEKMVSALGATTPEEEIAEQKPLGGSV